jgi:hypothetical protein
MHYVDAILQMTRNWNKVFMICSEVETEFYNTGLQRHTQLVQKYVENDGDFVGK